MRTPWHGLQILVSEGQYRALAEAAKERRTSLGALVREAVASHIGEESPEERVAIVRRMAQ